MLTTDLANYPRRTKRSLQIMLGLFALCVIAGSLVSFGLRPGMTWTAIWHAASRVPEKLLQLGIFGGVLTFLAGVLGYLAALGIKQRLVISGQSIEWSSALPSWATSLQPNWSISRSALIGIYVDLNGISVNPLAAKISFETIANCRAITLTRWYRIGTDATKQVTVIKRGFVTTDWATEIEHLEVIKALRESGLSLKVRMRAK